MHLGGAATLALVQHVALTAEGGGDVGQRGEIATGADRAFFRNQGQHVVLDERLEAFQQFHAHAGNAVAQRL